MGGRTPADYWLHRSGVNRRLNALRNELKTGPSQLPGSAGIPAQAI